MAAVGTAGGLAAIGAFALLTAFASATQDIAIDAWRIEAASDADEVGLMTSAAQVGYRMRPAGDRRLDHRRGRRASAGRCRTLAWRC